MQEVLEFFVLIAYEKHLMEAKTKNKCALK